MVAMCGEGTNEHKRACISRHHPRLKVVIMHKATRRLFLQALLISLLVNMMVVLVLANYAGAVHPLAPQRGVQELENIEVIKPPPRTIQVPEIKPPPRVVQAAPEITDDPDAPDVLEIPIPDFIPPEPGGDDPWIGLRPNPDDPGIGGEAIVPPQTIHAPKPEYPPLLREVGWSGSCTIGLHINEVGMVTKVWVIRGSGKDEADMAALAAARLSEWKPALHNGIPVPRKVSITYEFRVEMY